MIQAFKINKSVLSFSSFFVLNFDCFSLIPFVLSLLLLTIEGLFRANTHNSAYMFSNELGINDVLMT